MKKIDHISTTTRLLLLIVMLCLTAIQASAQQKVITGTVSEMLGKSKEPILGANVVLVNAQNRYIKGAVTDHPAGACQCGQTEDTCLIHRYEDTDREL